MYVLGRLNTEFDLAKGVTILENAQESNVFLVDTDHMDIENAVVVATVSDFIICFNYAVHFIINKTKLI